MSLAFKLVLALCLTIAVSAVPTWQAFFERGAISSLVQGASYIEALGPVSQGEIFARHLTPVSPGAPGNLTVAPKSPSPALFYISQNQLWHLVNETAIFPVNLVNVTGTSDFPLQLVSSDKRGGISTGNWRWQGTMLFYEQGSQGNQGIYYSCKTKDGSTGVFMFLEPSPTPEGCLIATLHSFIRQSKDN